MKLFIQGRSVSKLQDCSKPHETTEFFNRADKKMKKHVYVLIMCFAAVVFLIGCQSLAWYKDGASSEDFDRDLRSATWMASLEVGAVPVASGGTSGAIAAGIAHGMRRNELVKKYMLEKGWRLVPKDSGR